MVKILSEQMIRNYDSLLEKMVLNQVVVMERMDGTLSDIFKENSKLSQYLKI